MVGKTARDPVDVQMHFSILHFTNHHSVW